MSYMVVNLFLHAIAFKNKRKENQKQKKKSKQKWKITVSDMQYLAKEKVSQ